MAIRYRSELNKDTPLARPGEFNALQLGPYRIWPPVVLAPMAGITSAPYRTICRRYGAGLYVSEMITARALVDRREHTLKLTRFAPEEYPRSLQLYGVDPAIIADAVAFLVSEDRVDHIDMNFGCPVKKVTRRGGGAALPVKPNLLRNIVRAAVQNAGKVPVTIKFRVGINDEYQTYLSSGRIAEEEGCAAVALHARTAAQLYSGQASWELIRDLKEQVTSIPVLGNGDIWEAYDALRMMRETGCDGVVVGRGCLGKPWLFQELAQAFDGVEPEEPPNLGQIRDVMIEHAQLMSDWFDERSAMRAFRKHCTWYLKGFPKSHALIEKLMRVATIDELREKLADIDTEMCFPTEGLRRPRGKRRKQQKVVLPNGFLDDLEDDTPPGAEAEKLVSGG